MSCQVILNSLPISDSYVTKKVTFCA